MVVAGSISHSGQGTAQLVQKLGTAATGLKAPLARSLSIPPRVTWFRFGYAECAAVKLGNGPIKNDRIDAAFLNVD